jgi:hypothetical protein
MARALGREFPLKCACGHELHYDSNLGTIPLRCSGCQGVDPTKNLKSSSEIDNEIKIMRQQIEELQRRKAEAEKLEEFKRIDYKSLNPKFSPVAKLWIRKLVYEMRTHVSNMDTKKLFEILNYMKDTVEAKNDTSESKSK